MRIDDRSVDVPYEAGTYPTSPGWKLKVLASEQLFEVVNRLIQLAGLRYGYLKNSTVPLERTMRDLRSASLMYALDWWRSFLCVLHVCIG